MSDETPGAPASTPAADKPGAQPATPQVPLAILAQYVKDLSFENPRAPQIFSAPAAPQSTAAVTIGTRSLTERTYEVTLNLRIEGKVGEDTAYMVEVAYSGIFAIGPVPPELVEPLLMIEAPRLLFPFARAVAATATREGGFPQIMVNPIDFAGMYRNRRPMPAPGQPASAAGGAGSANGSAPASSA
jgi:preprotein translocase subunit SecB